MFLNNRQPSLIVDKRNIRQVPSSIDSVMGPITASHLPVYQPLNQSIQPRNTTINSGYNAERTQANNSNPFQNNIINNETTNLDGSHKLNETPKESISPPIVTSSSSFHQQYSPSVSQTSSISDRDIVTESPLPIMPNIGRGSLRSSYRNFENISPLAKINPILTSKSPPSMEVPSTSIPHNDEFPQRTGQLNYDYTQSEIPIATLDQQRIENFKQPVSSQMIHFQEIEDRMVNQLNELYKATMLIHSNQRDTPQRLEQSDIQQNNQPYLQHEPIYNSG